MHEHDSLQDQGMFPMSPSSINVLINYFSISGKYWLGSLKNISISQGNMAPYLVPGQSPSIANCTIAQATSPSPQVLLLEEYDSSWDTKEEVVSYNI